MDCPRLNARSPVLLGRRLLLRCQLLTLRLLGACLRTCLLRLRLALRWPLALLLGVWLVRRCLPALLWLLRWLTQLMTTPRCLHLVPLLNVRGGQPHLSPNPLRFQIAWCKPSLLLVVPSALWLHRKHRC